MSNRSLAGPAGPQPAANAARATGVLADLDFRAEREALRLREACRKRQRTRRLERPVWGVKLQRDATRRHATRVGRLAYRIGETLGLPDEDARAVRLSARLHDLGKISVPDRILQKSDRLTNEEFRAVKMHTIIGAALLPRELSGLMGPAREIALTHHERWDGTGYPDGRSGTDIPLAARIVAVADQYDALTHDRPYRRAWSEKRALEWLANLRGTAFDPTVFDAFLDVVAGDLGWVPAKPIPSNETLSEAS